MKVSRRQFVMGSIGLGASLWLSQVEADAPHLSVSDPAAKTVGHTEDASKINKSKNAGFANGQTCATCSLFQSGQIDGCVGRLHAVW